MAIAVTAALILWGLGGTDEQLPHCSKAAFSKDYVIVGDGHDNAENRAYNFSPWRASQEPTDIAPNAPHAAEMRPIRRIIGRCSSSVAATLSEAR